MAGFTPTEAMRNNSLRGKALQKTFKSTPAAKAGHISPDKAFELLQKSTISISEVKSLYGYLAQLETEYKPLKKSTTGAPIDSNLAWLIGGGSAGLAFCRKTLKEAEILKSYTKEIKESDLQVEDKNELSSVQIVKSVNEELMQATFLALAPMDSDEEFDLHEDTYTEAEVRKACHSFNQFCGKANLMHLVETSAFSIVESYITPVEMVLNDVFIKKGSWLTVLQFHDDELWSAVKSGEFTGVSIGATANVEYLTNED